MAWNNQKELDIYDVHHQNMEISSQTKTGRWTIWTSQKVVTSRKQTTIDHLPSGSRTWLAAKSPISMSFQDRQFLMAFPYDFPMTSSQFAKSSQGSHGSSSVFPRKLGDVPSVFPWFSHEQLQFSWGFRSCALRCCPASAKRPRRLCWRHGCWTDLEMWG